MLTKLLSRLLGYPEAERSHFVRGTSPRAVAVGTAAAVALLLSGVVPGSATFLGPFGPGGFAMVALYLSPIVLVSGAVGAVVGSVLRGTVHR